MTGAEVEGARPVMHENRELKLEVPPPVMPGNGTPKLKLLVTLKL